MDSRYKFETLEPNPDVTPSTLSNDDLIEQFALAKEWIGRSVTKDQENLWSTHYHDLKEEILERMTSDGASSS